MRVIAAVEEVLVFRSLVVPAGLLYLPLSVEKIVTVADDPALEDLPTDAGVVFGRVGRRVGIRDLADAFCLEPETLELLLIEHTVECVARGCQRDDRELFRAPDVDAAQAVVAEPTVAMLADTGTVDGEHFGEDVPGRLFDD